MANKNIDLDVLNEVIQQIDGTTVPELLRHFNRIQTILGEAGNAGLGSQDAAFRAVQVILEKFLEIAHQLANTLSGDGPTYQGAPALKPALVHYRDVMRSVTEDANSSINSIDMTPGA